MVTRQLVGLGLTWAVIALSGTSPTHAIRLGGLSASLGWSTLTSMPAPRAEASVAVGHDGNIYVFGGTNGVNEDYNTVFIYHPQGNSWSMGATLPFDVEGSAAVTLPDGRIMVIGGGTGCHNTQQCTTYKTVEAYNVRSHAWSLLAPMRTSHYNFPAVLGSDGRVYALGGWNGISALATVEAYDIRANNWTNVANLPQAEEGAAAVVTRHRIAVMGGYDGEHTVYNNLFVYDGRAWNSGSPMPTARTFLGAAVSSQGLIFAIGGFMPQSTLATVEAYDPKTDAWSRKAPLPRAVSLLGTAATADGRIYAIGGWYGSPSAQVAVYAALPGHRNPFSS